MTGTDTGTNSGPDTDSGDTSGSGSGTDWVSTYRDRWQAYHRFTGLLHALVSRLLEEEKLSVVQIESRAKDVGSFAEKVTRKGKNYAKPLEQMTDLVGLRVITYYRDDVDVVCQLLAREFTYHADQSVDLAEATDPDRFGYASTHYVLSLSESRRHLPEWAPFSDLRFEVQVRTALQHAWAAVSHKLDYKTQHEVPKALRRRMFQLSALFELADDHFSQLRDASTQLSADYQAQVSEGELDIPMDLTSLQTYLRGSRAARDLARVLRGAGYSVPAMSGARYDRDLRDLLRVLHASDVDTIGRLDRILSDPLMPQALDAIAKVRDWHLDPPMGGSFEGGLTDLLIVWLGADEELFESIYDPGDTPHFTLAKEAVARLRA